MEFGSPFIGSQKEYEADKTYQQFPINPRLMSERMFLSQIYGEQQHILEAFTLANKADTALERNDPEMCEKLSMEAIRLDPASVDGYFSLIKSVVANLDEDTVQCAIREIINMARTQISECIEERDGMFYSRVETRPYIRLLLFIAVQSRNIGRIEVATQAYEEVLRLNRRDNTGCRYELIGCYLSIIGRMQRKQPVYIKRTQQNIEDMIASEFDGDTLFRPEKDEIILRWTRFMLNYANKKEWKSLAKEEYKRSDLLFKLLFRTIPNIPPSDTVLKAGVDGFCLGEPSEEARRISSLMLCAFKEWPEFLIELRHLFLKPDRSFNETVRNEAPDILFDLQNEQKESYMEYCFNFLENGRVCLAKGQLMTSFEKFTLAKRACFEVAFPSDRWYVSPNAPFAIVSNRSTASFKLQKWNISRIDCRYTLFMKPDHVRTYDRLPIIMKMLFCEELVSDMEAIKLEASDPKEKTELEWTSLASKAIGLLSLKAIVLARLGQLTEEEKQKCINAGLEDLYTPSNFSPNEYPILPWLKEGDYKLK